MQHQTRPPHAPAGADGRAIVRAQTHPVSGGEHGHRRCGTSGGQFRATLTPTRGKNGAPRTGAHAQPEAVGLGPAPVVRLERPLTHQKLHDRAARDSSTPRARHHGHDRQGLEGCNRCLPPWKGRGHRPLSSVHTLRRLTGQGQTGASIGAVLDQADTLPKYVRDRARSPVRGRQQHPIGGPPGHTTRTVTRRNLQTTQSGIYVGVTNLWATGYGPVVLVRATSRHAGAPPIMAGRGRTGAKVPGQAPHRRRRGQEERPG
jgi:hypothetical protein